MHIRRNYRALTSAERERLVQALDQAKTDGVVDRYADIHAAHFGMGIHRSSHFLPWHRELLLRFERELQARGAGVMLPYWDSSVDQSPSDPLWAPELLGRFDAAWDLGRTLGGDTLPIPAQVETNQRRGRYDAFWRELETDIHNPPHVWVGGVMATARSPADPAFYFHHCWIDLLWVRWQLTNAGAGFVATAPGLGLTDPLMEWTDRTPADVLDHRALGYRYDFELAPESE